MKGILAEEYAAVLSDLWDYARFYGGARRVILAPYTHAALILTLVCLGAWNSGGWADLSLSVLPALLGFTLAAYALLLGFGDDRFRSFLADIGPEDGVTRRRDPFDGNLLLRISAIFLHFVVVQIVAIGLAVIANAHPVAAWHLHLSGAWLWRKAFAFMGFFTFALSLTTAVVAALNIFHATKWYVMYKSEQGKEEGE